MLPAIERLLKRESGPVNLAARIHGSSIMSRFSNILMGGYSRLQYNGETDNESGWPSPSALMVWNPPELADGKDLILASLWLSQAPQLRRNGMEKRKRYS